jgi:hypothetical protein
MHAIYVGGGSHQHPSSITAEVPTDNQPLKGYHSALAEELQLARLG